MIAELSAFSPPEQIAAWLAVLMFVLMIYNQGGKAIDRARGKAPQPPNESLAQSHAEIVRRVDGVESDVRTIKENIVGGEWFERMDKDISEIKSDLKVDRDANEKHASARSSGIYARINEIQKEAKEDARRIEADVNKVSREVSAVAAINTTQSQTLANIDAKISRLAERIK